MEQTQDTPISITTFAVLQGSLSFSLSFTCSTCGLSTFLTFVHGKDGIELLSSRTGSGLLNSSHSNLCSVRTGDGRLSISCGYCRSGSTILTLSLTPGGISCLSENSKHAAVRLCSHFAQQEHEGDMRPFMSVDDIAKIIYEEMSQQ